MEAVLWLVRTGSPWRDLPETYRLFAAMADDPDFEYAMIDLTIVTPRAFLSILRLLRGGALGYVPAGSSTKKRAPMMLPSAALRFSARMRPPWASMICFEMDRPRPEWVPNFSSLGRSE